MWERGTLIGGKDRQIPVDESIMPMPVDGSFLSTTWEQTGLTWADIIEQEGQQNGTALYRHRRLRFR
jgi:hypothetical protein